MVDFQIKIYNDLSNAQIDLINSFNKNNVRFLIIGGYAMLFYGSKRNTTDLDLLVNYDKKNVENIYKSFSGLKSKNIDGIKKNLSSPWKKLTWFDCEIITPEESINFDNYYKRAIVQDYNGLKFFFLSIQDMLELKEKSKRDKDLKDIKYLKDYLLLDKWPFKEPKNTAVFTTKSIVLNGNSILEVYHDEDDGSWQFHDGNIVDDQDAMIVAFDEIVDVDRSIKELSDLHIGWKAERKNRNEPWKISKQL